MGISTMDELVATTLAEVAVLCRSKAYKYHGARVLDEFSGRIATELTRGEVQAWAVRRLKTNRPGSVAVELAFLSRCFRVLASHGIDVSTPTRGVKLPPLNNWRERWLTTEEEERVHQRYLRRENGTTYWSLVQVALHTGLRRLEQLSLRVGDFQGDCLRVTTTKTDRPRTIPLNSVALPIVQAWANGRGYREWLFLPEWGPDRYKAGQRMCENIWKPCCLSAGVDGVTWRDLRRTFATRLIAKRESIYTVQALLGHTSTRQTQRYSVLALDTLRAAVDTLTQ